MSPRLSARAMLASTSSMCTAPTATCRCSSSRPSATGAPTGTGARSRIGRASGSRRSRRCALLSAASAPWRCESASTPGASSERASTTPPGSTPIAHRHGALAADSSAHLLDRLEPEARPILERAPVPVGAPVAEGREELHRQVASGRRTHVDDVEASIARAESTATYASWTRTMLVKIKLAQHRLHEKSRWELTRRYRRLPPRHAVNINSRARVRRRRAPRAMRRLAHEREVRRVILAPRAAPARAATLDPTRPRST